MANSVIVKLQLQDELSPELKKAQTELENLAKETLSLDSNLKELKANKKGIIKGAVKSDIEEVKKLQKEISALRKQSTEKGAKKTDIKNKILERELKITALINEKIKQQTILLNKSKQSQTLKSAQTDKALQKELRSRKKVTESIKSETTAIKSNNTSRMKENAERRALGTTVVRQIRRLESLAVAYYATTSAYNSTYGAGIKLNRQYQDLTLGLTALTSAGVDVSRNGTLLTGAEKFQALQNVTKDTLQQIKQAATETPATFNEMAGFYQQAIGHAIKSNGAMGTSLSEVSKNTIDLTKRMSNLGAAAGMEMYKVNEEIRSLMSGNASTDSLLAMMIFGSPAEANKAIKEAKTHVNGLRDLFNKVLAPFDALAGIDSYTKNMAKLTNEIETVQKAASKQMFKDFNNSIVDMTTYLKDNGDDIVKSFNDIYSIIKKTVPIVYGLGKAFLAYKAIGLGQSVFRTSKYFLLLSTRIGIATAAQRAFNIAALKNPYALIVAGVISIVEIFPELTDGTNLATKAMDDYAESIRGASKATLDFEASKITKEIARVRKLANDVVRERGINAPVQGGAGEKYAYELQALSEQLDLINKQKEAIKQKSKAEIDAKTQLEVKLKKAKKISDDAKSLKDRTAKINKLFSIINQQTQKHWDDVEKEKQQAIDLNNAKIKAYSDYIQIVGTKEEKFQDSIANKMSALYESGKYSTQQLMEMFNKLNSDHILSLKVKVNKKSFLSGWTDTVSKTFADGIQDAFDGNFNLEKLSRNLTKTMSNSMVQTSANNIASKSSTSGLNSVTSGDWVTMIIGIVLMGVTTQLDRYDKTTQALKKATQDLASATKDIAALISGDGTKISNTFSRGDTLISELNNAKAAERNFKRTDIQRYTDSGFTGSLGTNMQLTLLASDQDIMKTLGINANDQSGVIKNLFNGGSDEAQKISGSKKETQELRKRVVEAEAALATWTKSIINSADSLAKYSVKFGDMYDKLTGSSYFSDKRGLEAYQKVTEKFGMSLEDLTYKLANQFNISDITQFKKDLASDKSSQTFTDAMKKATEMMNQFGIDSLDIFDNISSAVDYMVSVSSKATSSISDISSAIEKLSGASGSLAKSSLAQFNSDMAMAKKLQNTAFDTSFNEYLQKAISGSSALLDSSNFNSLTEQKFAQASAINNFSDMSSGIESQIDVLKDIRTNTRNIDKNAELQDDTTKTVAVNHDLKMFDFQEAIKNPLYAIVAGFAYQNKLFEDGWKQLSSNFMSGFNRLNNINTMLLNNLSSRVIMVGSWLSNSFSFGLKNLSNNFTNSFYNLSNTFTNGIKVIGLDNPLKAIGDAIQKLANALNVANPISNNSPLSNIPSINSGSGGILQNLPSVPTPRIMPKLPHFGWETGGYTGNIPANNIAGVVHGQEYVINAPTTRDLGLNNGNGGVFKDILEQNKKLVEEIKTLNNEIINIKSNTEREYA